MAVFKSSVVALCALGALIVIGTERRAWGQNDEQISATASTAPVAQRPEINTGDHAWMLTSSALVLMMTAPGLALFYCGLVRKKNVLSVMMQCFFLMGLLTVVWALWGYSLAFGGDNGQEGFSPYVGNASYLFMKGCTPFIPEKDIVDVTKRGADGNPLVIAEAGKIYYPLVGTIPRLTHMLFQGMFFIITPALICGAFAERMKFSTMVVFMILWGTLVYCPLAPLGVGRRGAGLRQQRRHKIQRRLGGALDFAGGTVVHISSGVSALVCALVMGKRLGYGSEPMPPHNLTYTAIGAAMLWVGWFGFNAGSALAADGLAASAFAATHFAAAAGGAGLGRHGVDHPRQADRAGRLLRRGGRAGVHHAGRGLRHADAGPAHGRGGGRRLLPGLHVAQGELRLRRLARRLRRARRRRHAGGDPDRRLRHPGRRRRSAATTRWACSKAAPLLNGQVVAALASPGSWPPWARSSSSRCSTATMGLRVSPAGRDPGPRPQPARRRRVHLHLSFVSQGAGNISKWSHLASPNGAAKSRRSGNGRAHEEPAR